MLHMRNLINLVDSYNDDSESLEGKRVETNLNLEIGGFAKENEQLASYFVIPDTKYANSVGTERIKAVKEYTEGSDINQALIEAEGVPELMPPNFQKQYKMLMSLKGKVPLQEEHHTYCGTGTFDPTEVIVDGAFSTPAFLSTSLSVRVAVKTTNYRREKEQVEDDHVLHFVLPEGFSGGYYVAPYSHDPEELEYLIFPKERFQHVHTHVLKLDGLKRHVHTFKPV